MSSKDLQMIVFTTVVFSAVALLSGCTTAQPIMAPNGQQGFTVDCSALTMAQCYQKAGQLCGADGYTVFKAVDKRAGFFTAAEKQMVIACKGRQGEQNH